MLISVKGTYDHGRFVLDEPLPVENATIIVTIVEEKKTKMVKRKAGSLSGQIWMSDDFDNELHELLAQ